MEAFRVGLIGCGGISKNHVHALSETPLALLKCVCDIREERMQRYASAEVDCEADWRKMIARDDLDAVHICTPHYLHAEMAIAAMRAGKHVLCEKPMGVSAAEAREMARVSRETGKRLTICFQNRYNDPVLRLRELLNSGEAGKVLGGRAVMTWDRGEDYYRSDAWRGRWETEGGALMINQAIHTVDLVRFLLGDFEKVSSTLSAKRLGGIIECEDTADILLTKADGTRFLIYASNCAGANLPVELWLECEKLRLIMIGERLTAEDRQTGEVRVLQTESAGQTVGKRVWGTGHARLIPDFYEHLSKGEEPWITPEDTAGTAELLDRIYGDRHIIR